MLRPNHKPQKFSLSLTCDDPPVQVGVKRRDYFYSEQGHLEISQICKCLINFNEKI